VRGPEAYLQAVFHARIRKKGKSLDAMTLTVVVGSSGSGKTTFLDHVHKLHSCTYIRQYHTLRPYVPVKKIPKFDPQQLPYWNLYSDKVLKESTADGKKNESYNPGIKIGGTMAGEFTAGLSGGQRKMMLFELVRQRTSTQSELLIVLDEPFAGVTDDFVPYIMERLDEMRLKHNILLVTNDHVAALTKMADSTITVSAIDRSKVLLNGAEQDRELMLHAVAKGGEYMHSLGNQDLMFFMQTEVLTSPHVGGSMGFTVFAMIL
jgi:ABC-type lipoprotein export system ATPase subunit